MGFYQMADSNEPQRLWDVYASYQAQQDVRDDEEWHLDVSNFFAMLERYFFGPGRGLSMGLGWILCPAPPPVVWPATWEEVAALFERKMVFPGMSPAEQYWRFLRGVASTEGYVKRFRQSVGKQWP